MKIFLITSCDKIDYDYKLWTCVWDTAGKTGKKGIMEGVLGGCFIMVWNYISSSNRKSMIFF